MTLAYQNCSNSPVPSNTSSVKLANGEGYSGKVGLYRRFDTQVPCTEKDRDGKPLSNEQIFYQSSFFGGAKEPFVVRENCQDVNPAPIGSNAVNFDAVGNLSFKGRAYENYQANADFQVLASACPSGKTPIIGALRTNLIVNSQDWTEQPVYQGWMWHSGIQALLNGSIKSLPAYTISRTDPAFPEEFRRISQLKQLKPNTEYAFSFLAKKGTRDSINFRYFRVDQRTNNEEYIVLDFNLISGTATFRQNDFLSQATVTITPVGEGFFCTVFFKTSATAGENFSDFGFSPSAKNGVTRVGDSVFATAAQLETTTSYCK